MARNESKQKKDLVSGKVKIENRKIITRKIIARKGKFKTTKIERIAIISLKDIKTEKISIVKIKRKLIAEIK